MLLALDVGNSNIFGGVFQDGKLKLKFRKSSLGEAVSDELGIFLKAVLRENGVEPGDISGIAICSVVPKLSYPLRSACVKYFGREPFLLQPGVKTGLNIKYKNPSEVGADRIANAVGAAALYPGRNMVLVDFGTAITFCAVSKNRDYLGGAIVPGLKIAMEALASRAALLRTVELVRPAETTGRTTVQSIQSGLYYSSLGAVKEIYAGLCRECFGGEKALLAGTGGFSRLFAEEGLFDVLLPDLVLDGLRLVYEMNAAGGSK
ncbi:MAG: type III pantothenate kinase [Elusimicrobia bacterium]|nr:type III pantothenate kinase [Elusimicrobiota bacterium]